MSELRCVDCGENTFEDDFMIERNGKILCIHCNGMRELLEEEENTEW